MNRFIGLTAVAGGVFSTTAPLSVGTAENAVHCLHATVFAYGLLAACAYSGTVVTERRFAPETLKGSFVITVAVCHGRGPALGSHGSILQAELLSEILKCCTQLLKLFFGRFPYLLLMQHEFIWMGRHGVITESPLDGRRIVLPAIQTQDSQISDNLLIHVDCCRSCCRGRPYMFHGF